MSGSEVRLSDVLGGLSYALDLPEGSREGHSVRTCLAFAQVIDAKSPWTYRHCVQAA